MGSRAGFTAAHKLKSLAALSVGGMGAFASFCTLKGEQRFYDDWLIPCVHHFLDPERAHRAAVLLAKYRILPNWNSEYPELRTRLFGIDFDNCVGLAAGFDKDGEAVRGLFDWGFGFVEVGSVTPLPQPGNFRPRMFRLLKDQALINRYGFNSSGHENVKKSLYHDGYKHRGVVGVNLGKNKTSEDAAMDYLKGVSQFGEKADYLVVNVSSPNTPGLRSLQSKNQLKDLLSKIICARDKLSVRVPVLLKIAPDLSEEDKKNIAEVILSHECRVDGLIISNSTIHRPKELVSRNSDKIGGLSGKPLLASSTLVISDMYLLTNGKVPIIGVGGISSGEDAYTKIKAGASMVQIYTSLVYRGPPVVETIKAELTKCLKDDGYSNVAEAVGADHKIDAIVSKLIKFN
ncbi:dihydroorotate dehydrogenase (quinone) [Tropilaelaps mercedesae]|uniref:Dihydroorotate dehydrogenase (quinone), mitochondrial n=1 Tax=Tropilaelaps mercedesae TaxID=418985 RepID=A0A1V9XBH0_9ACAR|nr:dihydroorotate dehydrogenase (quinone) [Tropilaelaps mercedesae]